MNNSQTFRVGLIGAGYVSQFHIAALRRLPNVRIVGVCDLDAALAGMRAQESGARAFTNLTELLDAGVDVVHVLTPPSTHAALTIQALEHGCHVLVEKPLAVSVEDCDRIAAAAQRAGKSVCVNHSLLRDPFVVRALAVVESGAIGEVLAVDYLRSSDYPPYLGGPLPPQYRAGGYPFRDLGVHALYLLEAFLGELQNVDAEFRSAGKLSRDPNILFDEWRALVRCARGSGQIQISWNVRPIQNVLIVQGTNGVMRADMFSLAVTTRKSTPLPKSIERAFNAMNEGRQLCTQVPLNALRFLRKKLLPYHGLQMLVAEFYETLAAGRPSPLTPERARPIVDWTERVARRADTAKAQWMEKFPRELTAKVLLTGAAGFIGRHLLKRLLAQHDRVRILVRREPAAELMNDPRIEVVVGDLGNPEVVERAVAGTEIVYHVGAAMSGGTHDFQRGTVVGTSNVVEAVLKHRVPKLVYFSSLSVLHAAAAQPGCTMTESWPLEPQPELRGAYTQVKLDAEKLVLRAVKERGLKAVVLRPGQVFGPGAPVVTGAVARRVKGWLVILGDGTLALPLIYVEDLIDAVMLAAQRETFDGSVFHIIDSTALTQNDLVREYLQSTNQSVPITHIPRPIVLLLAVGVEALTKVLGRPAPLSRYRVRSALAPIAFDCAAARSQLQWTPRVGVRAGLAKTLPQ